ncbi:hypothetical protein [Pseudorhodobacter sp. E13]|uniref:hypothetical protein n=1 Tax=Pseudorhodobacter sp. E13 TaxID=2487931 RepID=UPI000F8EF367|nr:hypothetical protein [Pseudorhodobacter sp. E13]
MTLFRFAPVLLLLGCGVAQPVPQAARLSADQLTVVMSDGSSCKAPIGAGEMPGCGAGLSYRVDLVQNPNLLRRVVEGAFGALGAEGALAPMAEVTLTDTAGRSYRFVSPPPAPKE